MTLVSNDLAALEVRYKALRAKIKTRQDQQAEPLAPGADPYANTFGRSDVHIAALSVELISVAKQLVELKYNPLEIIEKMEGRT